MVGVLAALAVLSGPDILTGLAGLLLARLMLRFAFRAPEQEETEEEANQRSVFPIGDSRCWVGQLPCWRPERCSCSIPAGLGSLMASLPAYLSTWNPAFGCAGHAAAGRFAGLPAAGRDLHLTVPSGFVSLNDSEPLRTPLLVWFLSALLLGLLTPGRQIADLVWVLFPLWGLAALELQRYLPEGDLNPISLAQAGFMVVLLGLAWFTLGGFIEPDERTRRFRAGGRVMG